MECLEGTKPLCSFGGMPPFGVDEDFGGFACTGGGTKAFPGLCTGGGACFLAIFSLRAKRGDIGGGFGGDFICSCSI